MCGICGKINFNNETIDKSEIIAMRDTLIHRGPDDAGVYVDNNVGLGHRRLSIIDVSGSKQPLSNENNSIWIVYNGEIYNFQMLREEMLDKGHKFKTRGDTEVIVHLYEEYGKDFVHYLRGMFAFAIWDKNKRKLILMRDRLGIKPLYYYSNKKSFCFASEIKALFSCKDVIKELDENGLKRYLKYRFVYGEKTLFKGVRELLPGYCLEISNGKEKLEKYWDLTFSPKHDYNISDMSETLLTTLDESVKLRMISDVPIGSFLSGGVDSSAITGLMARNSASQVKTFSVGFTPEEENELKYARTVSEYFNSMHHEYTVGSEDFFSLMKKLIWHHDEPFIFPASVPLYILSKNTKDKATVILSGEGADELFAGYTTNVKAYWLNRFKNIMPDLIKRGLSKVPLNTKIEEIIKKTNISEREFIRSFFITYTDDVISKIFNCNVDDNDDDVLDSEISINDINGSFLDKFLAFQMKTYLIALLMKQDKMSMAASIETRVPFLDHKLVEHACLYPDSVKVKYNQGKHILKKTCESLLPHDIIYRKKMGFPVPIERWFEEKNNPFIEMLTDPETRRNTFLNYSFIEKTLKDFKAGVPGTTRHIWVLLNIEMWRSEFL